MSRKHEILSTLERIQDSKIGQNRYLILFRDRPVFIGGANTWTSPGRCIQKIIENCTGYWSTIDEYNAIKAEVKQLIKDKVIKIVNANDLEAKADIRTT